MIPLDDVRRLARAAKQPPGAIVRAERLRAERRWDAHSHRWRRLAGDLPGHARIETPEGAVWRVAYAVPSGALDVARDLRALGFLAYCPVAHVVVLHARKRRMVERAALMGYMFVLEDGLPITKGVHDGIVEVLSDACGPLRVSPSAVRAINDCELAGLFDRLPRQGPAFKRGDKVVIRDGALQGFAAVVRAVEAKTGLKLEVDLFGGRTIVRAKAESVEMAAG